MDNPVLAAISMLAIVLLVLVGAWCFTRWSGKYLGFAALRSSGARIRVLDRAVLGRDQALLVVKAGRRYLLLGSTPSGVTLLAELTEEEGEHWNPPPPPENAERKTPDFLALMQRLREKK